MKNRILLMPVLSFLLAAGFCEARIMSLVNINKGGMLSDIDTECSVNLTEENLGEGAKLSLKLEFSGPAFAGEWAPKKNNWAGWKYFKFDAFNPLARELTMSLVIRDETCSGYNRNLEDRKNWPILPFVLKPGMNKVELTLEGLKNIEGKPAGLTKITHWFFAYRLFPCYAWEEKGADKVDINISNLRLED